MRFSLKHHGQLSCIEHCPEGEYVLHTDYARLKAEVERLDTLCKQLMAQHSNISCENIMLRKAGDAMKFDCLNYLRELKKRPFWFPLLSQLEVNHKSVQRWNAAKEGKGQS